MGKIELRILFIFSITILGGCFGQYGTEHSAKCADSDEDGHFDFDPIDCGGGDDYCPDNQRAWKDSSCEKCVDADHDYYYSGCDRYHDEDDRDHCDSDPDNWSKEGCENCSDIDGDGHGEGCDRGPDCSELAGWIYIGCGICEDADGDGYQQYDVVACPTGTDYCAYDPNNWTETGCSNCFDNDGDGYGKDCDFGGDCDDHDPNNWTVPGCNNCVDNDKDGRGDGCDLGPDCDDDEPGSWTASSCANCVDADADGYGYACDLTNDCDDSDPNNWESCASCRDEDFDGAFINCDSYGPSRPGPDLDDSDSSIKCLHDYNCNGIRAYLYGADCDDDGDGYRNYLCGGDDINDSDPTIGRNKGTGTFGPITYVTNGSAEFRTLVAADFDNDGDPDLAVANYLNSKISIYPNTGSGEFAGSLYYSLEGKPIKIVTADFNEDGELDLAVTLEGGKLQLFTGKFGVYFNTHPSQNIIDLESVAGQLTAGDFNGDGHFDIAQAYSVSGNVNVIVGNGDGTFSDKILYSQPMIFDSLFTADFDKDGLTDYFTVRTTAVINPAVSVFYRQPDDSNEVDYLYGNSFEDLISVSIFPADIDGDGYIDILAAANSLKGSNYYHYLGAFINSSIGFENSFDTLYSIDPVQTQGDSPPDGSSLYIADLNGDEKLDLLWTFGLELDIAIAIAFGQ